MKPFYFEINTRKRVDISSRIRYNKDRKRRVVIRQYDNPA